MDLKATVISGEAPESDDDAGCISASLTNMVSHPVRIPNYHGTIISGEAPESDDDGASISSISGAVDAMACAPYAVMKIPKSNKSSIKYNSLLHKKLRDCNKMLDNDLQQLTEGTVNTATQELSVVNRQLLKSELILQEIVCQLRTATARTKETCDAFQRLSDASFLHSVKI